MYNIVHWIHCDWIHRLDHTDCTVDVVWLTTRIDHQHQHRGCTVRCRDGWWLMTGFNIVCGVQFCIVKGMRRNVGVLEYYLCGGERRKRRKRRRRRRMRMRRGEEEEEEEKEKEEEYCNTRNVDYRWTISQCGSVSVSDGQPWLELIEFSLGASASERNWYGSYFWNKSILFSIYF